MKSHKHFNSIASPMAPAKVGHAPWRKVGLVTALAVGMFAASTVPARAVDYKSSNASVLIGVELQAVGAWNPAAEPALTLEQVVQGLGNNKDGMKVLKAALTQAIVEDTAVSGQNPEYFVTWVLQTLNPADAVAKAGDVITAAVAGLKGSTKGAAPVTQAKISAIYNAAAAVVVADVNSGAVAGTISAKLTPLLSPAYTALVALESSDAAVGHLMTGLTSLKDKDGNAVSLGVSANLISLAGSVIGLPKTGKPAAAAVVAPMLCDQIAVSGTVGVANALAVLAAAPKGTYQPVADALLAGVSSGDAVTYVRKIMAGQTGSDMTAASFVSGNTTAVTALAAAAVAKAGVDNTAATLSSLIEKWTIPMPTKTKPLATGEFMSDGLRASIAAGVVAADPTSAAATLNTTLDALASPGTKTDAAVATKMIASAALVSGSAAGVVVDTYLGARLGKDYATDAATKAKLAQDLLVCASFGADSTATSAEAIGAIANTASYKALVVPEVNPKAADVEGYAAVLAKKLEKDDLGLAAFSKAVVASESGWLTSGVTGREFTKVLISGTNGGPTGANARADIVLGAINALSPDAAGLKDLAGDLGAAYSTNKDRITGSALLIKKLGGAKLDSIISGVGGKVAKTDTSTVSAELEKYVVGVAKANTTTLGLAAAITKVGYGTSTLEAADKLKLVADVIKLVPTNGTQVQQIVTDNCPITSGSAMATFAGAATGASTAAQPDVATAIGKLIKDNSVSISDFLNASIGTKLVKDSTVGAVLMGGIAKANPAQWATVLSAGATSGNAPALTAALTNAMVGNQTADAVSVAVVNQVFGSGNNAKATKLGPIAAEAAGVSPSEAGAITADLAPRIDSLHAQLRKMDKNIIVDDTAKVKTAVGDLGVLAGFVVSKMKDASAANIDAAITQTSTGSYGAVIPGGDYTKNIATALANDAYLVTYAVNATKNAAASTALFYQEMLSKFNSSADAAGLTAFTGKVVGGNATGAAAIAAGLANYSMPKAVAGLATITDIAIQLSVATNVDSKGAPKALTAASKAGMAAGLASLSKADAGAVANSFAGSLSAAADRTAVAVAVAKAVPEYVGDIVANVASRFDSTNTLDRIALIQGMIKGMAKVFPKQIFSEKVGLVVSATVQDMTGTVDATLESKVVDILTAAITAQSSAAYDIVGSALATLSGKLSFSDTFLGALKGMVASDAMKFEVAQAYKDVVTDHHTDNFFYNVDHHINGQETGVTPG